jgi:hypothetical protein
MAGGLKVSLDMPWNLVLACTSCNRGQGGKFDSLPVDRYAERLCVRNEALIESRHPLRETLKMTMGDTARERVSFVKNVMSDAIALTSGKVRWQAKVEEPAVF